MDFQRLSPCTARPLGGGTTFPQGKEFEHRQVRLRSAKRGRWGFAASSRRQGPSKTHRYSTSLLEGIISSCQRITQNIYFRCGDRGGGQAPFAPNGARTQGVPPFVLETLRVSQARFARTSHLTVLELRSFGPSHSPSAPPPMAISTGNPCMGVNDYEQKQRTKSTKALTSPPEGHAL